MSIFRKTIYGIAWKYGSEGEDLPRGTQFQKLLIAIRFLAKKRFGFAIPLLGLIAKKAFYFMAG